VRRTSIAQRAARERALNAPGLVLHQALGRAQGIVWPSAIAPYRLCIVVAASPKDAAYAQLTQAAEQLYDELGASGAPLRGEVILDDRNATTSFGYRLKDAALVGYPYVAVLGRSFLQNGAVELHTRCGPSCVRYVGATANDLTKTNACRVGTRLSGAPAPWTLYSATPWSAGSPPALALRARTPCC